MRLVRIGQLWINFDLVTCIRDLSDRDSSGQVTRGLLRLEFGGNGAVEVSKYYNELNNWLTANATSATS